ncbi:hypothetical protein [Paludibaculum fermentans]|uniref:Uncharacterized protein n=1 Tax=Paludibaculum fermentans TaxID=1473598 RepID=A0A7S7NN24_PALFE|nr:hypothetical protein [Paludibaculum fermentans]QOY86638.1 hypothetical protein IRI77_28185 [Paludibaculum fermentans]
MLAIASCCLFALAVPAAASQDAPATLLQRAQNRAEQFATEFPSMACTERLEQLKLSDGSKVQEHRESEFDYLLLVDASSGDFSVEESRIEKKHQKLPGQPLLSTTGFAVLLMIFLPRFSGSYHFEQLEPQMLDGVKWARLSFEHVGTKDSPSVLEVSGRQYPIPWKGVAWLDESTGQVHQIESDLREPLEDIGLVGLHSLVRYGAVGAASQVWLPLSAVIDARTRHQHWRNTHTFAGYRRFSVETESKVTQVKGDTTGKQ